LVEKYGPLPPERVVHLLRQLCGALQEAHAVGLIHRDIKPANVFASQRGGVFDVAKLIDFGLVKQGSQSSPDTAMNRGSFSGTPLYMSPEQASAYEDVDGRADIYSLGAVAFYLLTGQPPFTSKNVLELLAAHRNEVVAPPSQRNAAVPADLDQIILRCMAKNVSERFQDADALRNALERCSCANQWGPQEAATWWRSIEGTTKPERNEPEPAIDPTVQYLSNCDELRRTNG
jgi:serine/threonine-protein kinase